MTTTTRSGTFGNGYSVMAWLPPGYTLIEDSEAPARFVWANAAERTTPSYCEGDVTWERCETDAEWAAHLARLRAFYGRLIGDGGTQ